MNEIEELEDILDAILRGVQEILQSGETIPLDFQRIIAEEINFLTADIDRLYAEQPTDELPPIDEIEAEQETIANEIAPPAQPPTTPPTGGDIPSLTPAPHPSSNINSFRYEPETQQLYIKFQDKYPGTDGPVYKYSGVPQNTFNIFQRGSVAPRTSGANAWHRWEQGKAPSHGASAYALIREGGYPFVRMS